MFNTEKLWFIFYIVGLFHVPLTLMANILNYKKSNKKKTQKFARNIFHATYEKHVDHTAFSVGIKAHQQMFQIIAQNFLLSALTFSAPGNNEKRFVTE